MNRSLRLALLAIPLFAGASLQASASTITNVQVNYSQGIVLSGGVLQQATGSSTMNVGIAGQIVLTTNDPTTSAPAYLGVWCIDLLHDIYLGGSYNFNGGTFTTNNLDGSANVVLSAAQIQGIEQAAAFGNAILQPTAKNTISTSLAAAYTSDLASSHFSSDHGYANAINDLSAISAAVQATIWDIEYGTTATGSSQFMADMGLVAAYDTYFSNIGGIQLNVVSTNGVRAQDQYLSVSASLTPTSSVPEPGSLSLVGLGLMGLVGSIRQRRRAGCAA